MNQRDIDDNTMKILLQSLDQYEASVRKHNEFVIAADMHRCSNPFGVTPIERIKIAFADNAIMMLKQMKDAKEKLQEIQELTK